MEYETYEQWQQRMNTRRRLGETHEEFIRRRVEEEKRRHNRWYDEVFAPPVPTPHIDRALAEVSPPESENDRIWRLLQDAARGT